MARRQQKTQEEIEMEELDRIREEVENGGASEQADGGRLPALAPVLQAVMDGFGEGGPHFERIRIIEKKTDPKTGEVMLDNEGDPIYRQRFKKVLIGPYKSGKAALATTYFQDVQPTVMVLALAWSFQGGDGDLDPSEAIRVYQQYLPDDKKQGVTEEQIVDAVNGGMPNWKEETVEAMIDLVHLAFATFDKEIEREFVEDHIEVPELVRLTGKILFLNGGLRKSFLP